MEFKKAKRHYPFAVVQYTYPKERRPCIFGYIVAIANEKGDILILEMSDKLPHLVVGIDFAPGNISNFVDEVYIADITF